MGMRDHVCSCQIICLRPKCVSSSFFSMYTELNFMNLLKDAKHFLFMLYWAMNIIHISFCVHKSYFCLLFLCLHHQNHPTTGQMLHLTSLEISQSAPPSGSLILLCPSQHCSPGLRVPATSILWFKLHSPDEIFFFFCACIWVAVMTNSVEQCFRYLFISCKFHRLPFQYVNILRC